MRKYHYYENGTEEIFTESELKKYFDSCEDLEDQKAQGTTFKSWLSECVQMQIYIYIYFNPVNRADAEVI